MKYATDEQVSAIVRFLVSGRLGFDEAQAIIDTYGPNGTASLPGFAEDIFAPMRMPPHIALLEPRFRDNGVKFAELLAPFFRWHPALKAFNRALVKAGTTAYDVLIWKSRAFACSRMEELRQSRVDRGDAVVIPNTGGRSVDTVATQLFNIETLDIVLARSSLVAHMGGLPPWVFRTLVRSLATASVDVLCTNAPVSFYVPFFRMWLEGNWPLGISKENELLLLVSD